MMKRSIVILATLMLAGCASPGTVQTPAQVAARVCPSVQIALTSLQSLNGVSASMAQDMATAVPIVDSVCAAGVTVSTSGLKSLATSAVPLILSVAKASALSDAEQDRITLGLAAVQIIIGSVQ